MTNEMIQITEDAIQYYQVLPVFLLLLISVVISVGSLGGKNNESK